MNTQTLNGVTLKTLDNSRSAATQAMAAYRLGGRKLVSAVNSVLANRVYPRTAGVAPQITVRMNEARESISNIVVKGIDGFADRTVKAIESGSSAAAAQLKKVSGLATGVQNPAVANGLQTAARLTMPGANVALALSSRVVQGANALADAAGARPLRKAVRKAARKTNRRAR